MKIAAKIVLTSLICFCFFTAKAQPLAGNGCMNPSTSRVHQTYLGTRYGSPMYNGNLNVRYSEWTVQYDITDYPCFQWTQTGTNDCYLRTGTSSSNYAYTLGNSGYFTGTSGTTCLPLDDYIPVLALIVAGISFFYIRRFGIISG